MSRLIDADALAEKIECPGEPIVYWDDIESAPTVDALPLRCRIGDTVWVVGTKCLSGHYEEECDSAHNFCCDCHLDQEYTVFSRRVYSLLFLYIHDLDNNDLLRWGETVFSTKEEAESALAKMDLEADHGKQT